MTDLLLGESEQAAVRAVIASDPVPDAAVLGEGALEHLARLIDCDAIGIAVTDGNGAESLDSPARATSADGSPPVPTTPARVGLRQRDRMPRGAGTSGGRGVAVLSLGVRSGHGHVVTLWMVRRTSDFSARDRALLALVSPALERLLREHRATSLVPTLTVQERRVLHHVATGMSNAEIAARLVVAPCTVRKHLENAYRKLGVTNRLAAVNALEGGRRVDVVDVVDVVDGRRLESAESR